MAAYRHPTNPLSIPKSGLQRGRLDGEVAVVTGAGQGIGFGTARSLAWLGAKVVIADVNKELGEEAAAFVNEECGRDAAIAVATDIASEESMQALGREVLGSFGKVDVLVNNAMITTPDSSIASWDRIYGI